VTRTALRKPQLSRPGQPPLPQSLLRQRLPPLQSPLAVAMDAACPAHQAQLVTQADTANQVVQELQAPQVPQAAQRLLALNQHPHQHASHAQPDHPDHQAQLESPVMQDQPDQLPPVVKEQLASPVPKAHQDLQDQTETMANQVHQVRMLLEVPRKLASPDPPETQDQPVLQDPQAQLALTQPAPEPQARRDQGDHPDQLVPMASLALMDPQARTAVQARRVSARNTARSMVACSSKMEPSDSKRRILRTVSRLPNRQPFKPWCTTTCNHIDLFFLFGLILAL